MLAFKREGYKKTDVSVPELAESLTWPGFQKVAFKYWQTGWGEMYRSFSKRAFTKALQKLMPSLEENDLAPGGAGVRAQACDRTGGLIDDFLILKNKVAIYATLPHRQLLLLSPLGIPFPTWYWKGFNTLQRAS